MVLICINFTTILAAIWVVVQECLIFYSNYIRRNLKCLRKISKSLAVGVLTVMMMLVSVVPAFANTTPEQAQSALTGEVYNKLSSENYELSGWWFYYGEKLFKEETLQDGSVSYVIVSEQYDALSRSGQQKFAKKLGQVVEASYAI